MIVAKAPSPNGCNGHQGRDARGRFTSGNPGGPGNPLGAQVAKLRTAMVEAVSVEDLREIAKALTRKAAKGDVSAAKVVLAYTLGRPCEIDVLERLEALEELAAEIEQTTGRRM